MRESSASAHSCKADIWFKLTSATSMGCCKPISGVLDLVWFDTSAPSNWSTRWASNSNLALRQLGNYGVGHILLGQGLIFHWFGELNELNFWLNAQSDLSYIFAKR